MRVKVDRNDYLNQQIMRAVYVFADADTRENAKEFSVTPAQATLMWWALKRLEAAIRDSARWAEEWNNLHQISYADTLRCHADAVEWCREFRHQLADHAKAHQLEVQACR